MTTTPPQQLTAQEIRDFHDRLVRWEPAAWEHDAIDRIRAMEDVTSAIAAAQAVETAGLERSRLAAEQHRGVPKARRGKGLAAEIGLARRQSQARGSQHLQAARALTSDLPNTLEALSAGRIREEHALKVVSETASLNSLKRKMVDAAIAERVDGLGPKQLADEVRAHVQRIDPEGTTKRAAQAKQQRRVTSRPLSDGMGLLSAVLPMEVIVAAHQSLDAEVDRILRSGDETDSKQSGGTRRTREQIAADLFGERVSGQRMSSVMTTEMLVVMTDAALLGQDETPAWLPGHGPIPADTARRWCSDPEAKIALRRLFTRPEDGQLIGMESRSRDFPASLRQLVLLRDQRCRTPYCDAPIRQIDHIVPARDGCNSP